MLETYCGEPVLITTGYIFLLMERSGSLIYKVLGLIWDVIMAIVSTTAELIRQLGALSYLGVFGVSIIANVIVPFPEEIVLLGLGYLAGTGHANLLILIPIVIAGLLVSDVIMFSLSKSGNKWVKKFYEKIFSKSLESRREWLETHINKVIFFSRFLVQLRFLGPFLAGQAQISLKRFLKYEIAALLIYVPLYLWVGFYFRNRIEFIASGISAVKNIILIVVGIGLLLAISKLIRRKVFKIN